MDAFISTMHTRLAAVEGKLGLPTPITPPSVGTAASSSSAVPSSGSSAAAVNAYDEAVAPALGKFVASGKQIGGRVEQMTLSAEQAFNKLRDIIQFSSEHKKPTGTDFMSELNAALSEVQSHKNARDDFENHAKALSEGLPALAWVNPALTLPAPFALDMCEASVFWANKVRSNFKSKENGDQHVAWCKELDATLRGLHAYIKANFPTGLAWNAKGKDAGSAAPVAAAASSAAPAAAPAATGATALNLFAELSKIDQSSGKTAGLKHVTKDMKSSANKDAPAPAPKAPAPKKKDEPVPAKQVFALQGNKWVVEGQTGVISITADQVSVKHSVYIYNCVGATIQIEGKCNTITIDSSRKLNVIFQDVLALCEVVNSKQVQVQCKGKAPTVSIDKTDGITVFLSRDTMYETKIVASKSSEMNCQFPGATDEDAWIEKVIPEQYVHLIQPNNTISADISDLYTH